MMDLDNFIKQIRYELLTGNDWANITNMITARDEEIRQAEREACADRAIAFYDLGFSLGQDKDLRAAILGK